MSTSIDKLNYVVLKILNTLGVTNDQQEDGVSLCINLCVLYMTNFKYKFLSLDSSSKEVMITLCNKFLSLTNSHFVLVPHMTKEEFINFVLYFMTQYNYVHNNIEYLAKVNRKYFTANIRNILTDQSDKDNNQVSNNEHYEDIRTSFTKFNITLKDIKKQTDLLINLIYKLNAIKNNQDKPISSLKVEELILLNEGNYRNYLKKQKPLMDYVEQSLSKINLVIDMLKEASQLYLILSDKFVISNLLIMDKTSLSAPLSQVKLIFKTLIKILHADETDPSIILCNWIHKLESKIYNRLSEIKLYNKELNQNSDTAQILHNLASQLEKYVEANKFILNSFTDENKTRSITKTIRQMLNGSEFDEVLETNLILTNTSNLNNFYDMYTNEALSEINRIVQSLDYTTYNYR